MVVNPSRSASRCMESPPIPSASANSIAASTILSRLRAGLDLRSGRFPPPQSNSRLRPASWPPASRTVTLSSYLFLDRHHNTVYIMHACVYYILDVYVIHKPEIGEDP